MFISILSLLKNTLTNSDGLIGSFIPYITGDSRTTLKTSGHGPIHWSSLLTLSLKPSEWISVTGTELTKRRRILCLENLLPPSIRLPIKNLNPAHLQNLVSPPNPHHHPPPTRQHQPLCPHLELRPRPPTPIKICLRFLDRMANSFLKRKNTGRNSASVFSTVSRTIALLRALISPTLRRPISQPVHQTRPNPRAILLKQKMLPTNLIPSWQHPPMPQIFSTQPHWCARPLWSG